MDPAKAFRMILEKRAREGHVPSRLALEEIERRRSSSPQALGNEPSPSVARPMPPAHAAATTQQLQPQEQGLIRQPPDLQQRTHQPHRPSQSLQGQTTATALPTSHPAESSATVQARSTAPAVSTAPTLAMGVPPQLQLQGQVPSRAELFVRSLQQLHQQDRQRQQQLQEQQRHHQQQQRRQRQQQQHQAAHSLLGANSLPTSLPPPIDVPNSIQPEEEEDDFGEETQEEDVHTYSEYRSERVRALFPQIRSHPDPLVETASLASVPLPQLTFRPHDALDEDIRQGKLSDAQLETVLYACMKFAGPRLADDRRAGFFLGDGAGVGKGRQIAALIKQHWAEGGRYVLWVSVSQDLREDARRDLADMNAKNIPIYSGKNHIPENGSFKGVVFVTYSLLRSGLPKLKKPEKKKKRKRRGGAATAAELAVEEGNGGEDERPAGPVQLQRIDVPPDSRLGQVIKWLKHCSEGGLIVFDESHLAKNLVPSDGSSLPTQTGMAVMELQEALPDAKVLYSSATGASEPRNLAYMTRLGMWGMKDAQEMIKLLESSKLGALELAAMSLKGTGYYLARTLSYKDAEMNLAYVTLDPVFEIMYDRSCELWLHVQRVLRVVEPLALREDRTNAGRPFSWWANYWAANLRFYRAMLMAAKVPAVARLAQEAIEEGMAVVIGLQSTGEANTEQQRELQEGFDDLVSAPRMILRSLINNMFPTHVPGTEENDPEALTTLRELQCYVYTIIKATEGQLKAKELVRTSTAAAQTSHDAALARTAQQLDRGVPLTEEELRRIEEMQREAKQAEWRRARNQIIRRQEDAVTVAQRIKQTRTSELERIERHIEVKSARIPSNGDRAGDEVGSIAPAARLHRPHSDEDDDHKPAKVLPTGKQNGYLRKMIIADSESDDDEPIDGGGVEHAPAGASSLAGASASFAQASARLGSPPRPGSVERRTVNGRTALFVDLTGDTSSSDDEEAALPAPAPAVPVPAVKQEPVVGGHALAVVKREDQGASTVVKTEPAAGAPMPLQSNRNVMNDHGVLDDATDSADVALTEEKLARMPLGELRMRLLRAEDALVDACEALDVAEKALKDLLNDDATGPPPMLGHAFAGEGTARANTSRRSNAGRRRQEQRLGASVHAPATKFMTVAATPVERYAVKQAALPDVPDELARLAFGIEDEGPAVTNDQSSDQTPNLTVSGLLRTIKEWLLKLVAHAELPPNPLDQLINLLGGESKVSELTGRRGYVARNDEGIASYKQRGGECPQREINLREKEMFMQGRKLVAIISEAASTGISLQADRRKANQRRRCHITLELPWAADKAIQQFGRSHRANQVSAPVYRIAVTPCGGEHRFAAAAAKRLASLGALLRGDRNAVGAGQELKSFDIDNAEGQEALTHVLQVITGWGDVPVGMTQPQLPPDMGPLAHEAAADGVNAHSASSRNMTAFELHFRYRLHEFGLIETNHAGQHRVKGNPKVTQFLNRLLGLPVKEQHLLFQFYSSMYDAMVARAREHGKLDSGITSIQARSCVLRVPPGCDSPFQQVHHDPVSGAKVHRVIVAVDRGVSWDEALTSLDEARARIEAAAPGGTHLSGFYYLSSHHTLAGVRRRQIVLATEILTEGTTKGRSEYRKFRVQHPHGHKKQNGTVSMTDLKNRFTLVRSEDEAKAVWESWFNYTATKCIHGDKCHARRRSGNNAACKVGNRFDDLHLLCGAVLPLWRRIEHLHADSPWGKSMSVPAVRTTPNGGMEQYMRPVRKSKPLQVVRVITSDTHTPVVGIQATDADEMDFLVKNLVPENSEQDYLLRTRGTVYRDGPDVPGLNAGAAFMNRSKRPKNFR